MPGRKVAQAIAAVLISLLIFGGYRLKQGSKIDAAKVWVKSNYYNLSINSSDVELINRAGGLPLNRWKVLFAHRDNSVIDKIVTLVNASNKIGFDLKNYGSGKAIGYPVSIEIKLLNSEKWIISPLFKVTSRKLENGGMESTAAAYKDRVELDIENGGKTSSYTLFSEQLTSYVLEGANQDMPYVTAFSLTPDTIKPGQLVTISGDGSTEKFIEIYITDGNSANNEKYLIAKVPISFGAWKWEGTVNGRSIKTLEGKEIKLTRDRYYFQTTVAGGGMIDLIGSK